MTTPFRWRTSPARSNDAALRAIEVAAISDVIALQERIGLRVVMMAAARFMNGFGAKETANYVDAQFLACLTHDGSIR
jgi:hypothetical protein